MIQASRSDVDATRAAIIRPLLETDLPKLFDFIRGLSFAARYFRFGHGDYDPGQMGAPRDCLLAPEQGLHLIAVSPAEDGEAVVGSARYVIQPDRTRCEFALVVADDWKHHGLGHRLMQALQDHARERGMRILFGYILESNLDMLEFVRTCGFEIGDSAEGPWQKLATLHLQ